MNSYEILCLLSGLTGLLLVALGIFAIVFSVRHKTINYNVIIYVLYIFLGANSIVYFLTKKEKRKIRQVEEKRWQQRYDSIDRIIKSREKELHLFEQTIKTKD